MPTPSPNLLVAKQMPAGFTAVCDAIRREPASVEANTTYAQAWIRIGSPTDVRIAIDRASQRVKDAEWHRDIQLAAMLALGQRTQALTRFSGTSKTGGAREGILCQLRILEKQPVDSAVFSE